jgi:ATPases with chaperone activity, ATP-binding subunit
VCATSRARLDNPNKPVGVFMLCGPSGVGKTETALALAESLYGGEQNIITINMSEFQEAHYRFHLERRAYRAMSVTAKGVC